MLIEDVVGHLVLATRRPVRLELTREEEFVSARTRHAQTLTFRTGVDRRRPARRPGPDRGRQHRRLRHARLHRAVGDRAARASPRTTARPSATRCDVVYTNRPVAGAMRGYGAPQGDVRARVPHGRHRPRARARPASSFVAGTGWGRATRSTSRRGSASVAGSTDVAPEDLPRITSCGTEECVAQAAARDRLGAPRRPVVEAAARPAAHPSRHRLRVLHAGLGHPQRRHGRGLDQDERRRLVQPARRCAPTSAPAPTPCWPRSPPRCSACTLDDIIVYSADTDLTPVRRRRVRVGHDLHLGHGGEEGRRGGACADRRAGRPPARRSTTRPRSSCATVGLGRPTAARSRSATSRCNSLHTEDQEQIMGTASHLATSRRPRSPPSSPRSRSTSRPARSTVDEARHRGRLRRGHQPDDRERPGRGRHAHGASATRSARSSSSTTTGRPVNAQLGPYWIFRADDAPPTEVFLVQTHGALRARSAPRRVGEIATDGVAPAVRNAILDATGVAVNDTPAHPRAGVARPARRRPPNGDLRAGWAGAAGS